MEESKVEELRISSWLKDGLRYLVRVCFNHRKIWSIVGILVIILILWKVLGTWGVLSLGDFPRAPASQWQAVFLTNGQVYFGHLKNYNRGYVTLKEIYYLQAPQPLQQGREVAQNLNLVKLGGELHGPQDQMFIPKDRILFWENMKNDSQVVRAIQSTRK